MKARSLLLLTTLIVGACAEDALPSGYSIARSAMNREWLQGPDGGLVAPGLIKSLHRDGDRILLIAHAATSGDQTVPPTPIDNTCFVAFSINAARRQVTQITIAEANRMAVGMVEVLSTDRGCH